MGLRAGEIRWKSVIGALLLAGLVWLLQVRHFGDTSLGVDDGVSLVTAASSLADMFSGMCSRGEVHPPLYFYWLHFWVPPLSATSGLPQHLGGLEVWCRLSNLPWIALTLWLTHALARRLLGETAAWWAALLWATSSYAVYYNREVRMYPMLTALLLAASLFATQVFEPADLKASSSQSARRRRTPLWAFVGCASLAFFTHYLALVFVVPILVAGLLEVGRLAAQHPFRSELRTRLAVSLGAASLVLVLWAPTVLAQAHSQTMLLRPAPGWPQCVGLAFLLSCGPCWGLPLPEWTRELPPGWSVSPWHLLGLLAVLWGLGQAWRLQGVGRNLVLGFLTIPLVLVVAVSRLTPVHIFEYKYFQPVMPFLCLAWSIPWRTAGDADLGGEERHAARPREDRRLRIRIERVLSCALVAVQLLGITRELAQPSWYGAQDWRQVAGFLEAGVQPGEGVLVHPSMMAAPLYVYAFAGGVHKEVSGGGDLVQAPHTGLKPGGLAASLRPCDVPGSLSLALDGLSPQAGLWLVTTPAHPFVAQQGLLNHLLTRYRVVSSAQTKSFWPANRILVLHLQAQSPSPPTPPPLVPPTSLPRE